MLKQHFRIHIGLRTLKTAVAVILSMVIVNFFGTTQSKLIFAMLGAMAAVQPTFAESVESCLTQIVGVLLGALAGLLLLALRLPPLVSTGIGIIFVITLYNVLRLRFSPSLACFIVVMLCTSEGIHPLEYALGRIWDSAIGLGVGMLINTLVFPYDNSRQIQATVRSLDTELIGWLEDLFDGDENLPGEDAMTQNIELLAKQLMLFSNQKLFLRLRRQKEQLENFRQCQGKAKELLAQMAVLHRQGRPGRLSEENRRRLTACGASIRDERPLEAVTERDVVTNYHVAQILKLRRELLDQLQREDRGENR